MSRIFNGTSDAVAWSIGACGITGAYSVVALIKMDAAAAAWQSLLGTNGTNSGVAIGRRGTDGSFAVFGGGGGQYIATATTIGSADGWCLFAHSKAAGVSQPRAHKYPVGGSATHVDTTTVSGTLANPSESQTSVHFGEINGADFFNGRVAALGIATSVLSDANIESLVTTLTRANWVSLLNGVWDELDAFASDRTGNGATRTTLTGTTDDPADNPAGWASWSGSAAPLLSPLRVSGPSYAAHRAASI